MLWGWSGVLQTMLMSQLRVPRALDVGEPEHRVIRRCPDGGSVAVDRWGRKPGAGQRTLVIFHGLTGGSHEAYVRSLAKTALASGVFTGVLVQNFRGCADSEITSAVTYSAGATMDAEVTIREACAAGGLVCCAGFSLGANVLTKTVGEMGRTAPSNLKGFVALCNPFDLVKSSDTLMPMVSRKLASNLVRFVERHEGSLLAAGLELHPEWRSCKSVREFDERLTARNFGYRSVEDYYADASSSRFIRHIAVPGAFLTALDDPICPEAGIPLAEILHNPALVLVTTRLGGHVAWATSNFSRTTWSDATTIEILSNFLDLQKE